MAKEKKDPVIIQQDADSSLYNRLQQHTLDEVQRLSGKVWTDFNVHDPGVTLMDIANYALTETDYKLRFELQDYLTTKEVCFDPIRFGLFPVEAVYTTAPVTTEDYRKLLYSHVPSLDSIWVICNNKTGGYTVRIALPPYKKSNEDDIIQQVKEVYNSHRNLCEYLEKVEVVHPEELELWAELEIEQGADPSVVLAKIYEAIHIYLSGAFHIYMPEERKLTEMSPEEWLEGSSDGLRVEIPEQKNTEYELYKRLWSVDGVHSFSTCYLMKNGMPQTDFSEGFTLKIPKSDKELKVKIRCGKTLMTIEMKKFNSHLDTYYASKERNRNRIAKNRNEACRVKGNYRDIFTHTPLACDFPLCYNLPSPEGKTTSFEAYLKLYDWINEQGLEDLKELPHLLSFDEPKDDSTLSPRKIKLFSSYLDFLDSLYGVESNPQWLKEENCYGETEIEVVVRRMEFLRHTARMTRDRAKAKNLSFTGDGLNTPTVKEWFCRLLGINSDDEHTVSNVLPGHNLRLIEKRKNKPFLDRLDALLIDEKLFNEKYVNPVSYEQTASDDEEKRKEYSRLRTELPIFNDNRISGDLFRHGLSLDNYRIVEASKGEYMLIYRNQEKEGWTNLGRTDNKEQLNTLANILRKYLLELNRDCETVYILESVLVKKEYPFHLLIVLPDWTLRFHTPRFREMCRNLLRSIIPAHISGEIYWLDEKCMQRFENGYRQLMNAIGNGDMKDYCDMLYNAIYELLQTADEKQFLDDNY